MTKQTILIIEDEQDIRELLIYNLQKEGYAALSSGDGQEGLDLARSELPDLILLDLMLPGLDGFSVCRARRVRIDGYCPNTRASRCSGTRRVL